MNGWEQLTVWLFGIFCVSVTVGSAVKAVTESKAKIAEAHADVAKTLYGRAASIVPSYPPANWTTGGGQ